MTLIKHAAKVEEVEEASEASQKDTPEQLQKRVPLSLQFYKYEGTGNDFILIDNREGDFPKQAALISALCSRRLGIGADGLILIERSSTHAFHMRYFNADSSTGLCANGARCAVALAAQLGIIQSSCSFSTQKKVIEGKHCSEDVCLEWSAKSNIEKYLDGYVVEEENTHFVHRCKSLPSREEVRERGASLQKDRARFPKGTNVHFVQIVKDELRLRSYERGVENETLSCGTGALAAVLVAEYMQWIPQQSTRVHTLGGPLQVQLLRHPKELQVRLSGQAKLVYSGSCSPRSFISK